MAAVTVRWRLRYYGPYRQTPLEGNAQQNFAFFAPAPERIPVAVML